MPAVEPIRIALLCNSLTVEAWEADALRQVLALPFVQVVLVIENATPHQGPTLRQPFRYPWRRLLWRGYKRLRLAKISAVQPVDLSDELEKLPRLKAVVTHPKKHSDYFSDVDLARIREAQPDVLLRFGFGILRGDILTVAKHGVWSYHHGDEQRFRGGPPGFWEIVRNVPATGAILQRLTPTLDSGIVLRKGYFPTLRKSYRAQLNQLLHGTSGWMKQALLDVHLGNTAALLAAPATSSARITTFPVNLRFVLCCFQRLGATLSFHYTELFRHERWSVGIVPQALTDIAANGLTQPVQWLPDPPDHEFYADPFGGTLENGEELILCEHYSYRHGKGVIARLTRSGIATEWLEREHHLSYPFLFPVGNQLMLLPESQENYNVSLRNAEQPEKTEMHLLHGVPAVDSSVVEFEGKWWLFCTREDDGGANYSLHIFCAENSDSTFEPHANNPVKTDVRSARPGGTPFVHNGKLYRPAQDCAADYGFAVVLNEITTLTTTAFAETPVRTLRPQTGWRNHSGLHTLSYLTAGETLLDAKRYAFSAAQFRRVLRRKLRRFFSR